MRICLKCDGIFNETMPKCTFCGSGKYKEYKEPHAPAALRRGAITKPAGKRGRRLK